MHVILHILADLNGRIDGPFFADQNALPALGAYGRLRGELKCDAVVYGQTTMAEGFSDGLYPHAHSECLNHFEDHVADDHASNYLVSLDPFGTLDFDGGSVAKKDVRQRMSFRFFPVRCPVRISIICANAEFPGFWRKQRAESSGGS